MAGTTRTTRKAPAQKVAEAPTPKPRPTALTPDVLADLRRPFTAAAVKFKPQSVSKTSDRAMASFYIDARLVAERLNLVVGPENWSNDPAPVIHETPEAWKALQFPVVCRLTVFGVTKVDVGIYQKNAADALTIKSSYSDSLKRAAVLFGVGAYLYAIPNQWFDYDKANKRWKNEALIRRSYEQAIAKLAIGEPIDHGDLSDPETADGQVPAEVADSADSVAESVPARASAEAAQTKRDPAVHVTDKQEILNMVALAREAGFSEETIEKVLRNERDANGGHYRKTWLVEQLQELTDTITENAAKKAAA